MQSPLAKLLVILLTTSLVIVLVYILSNWVGKPVYFSRNDYVLYFYITAGFIILLWSINDIKKK